MNLTSILRPQKGRAPVPEQMPGEFFVLEYDREGEGFTLHVDDEDHSTYDLGNDIAELQVLFRTRRTQDGAPLQPRQIGQMIDIARELGMAQYIPQQGELVADRVLSIVLRSAPKGLDFNEQDEETNWRHHVR